MEFTENRWLQLHGRAHGSDLILVDPVRGPFYTIGQGITEAVARQLGAPAEATRMCVWVNPGVYTEALVMQPFVDVKAVGTPEQTVIQQVDATVVTLASNCDLEGFTIRITTPTVARNMIIDNAAALTGVNIRRNIFAITTPAALDHRILHLTGGSTVNIDENVASLGGTGLTAVVNAETAASTLTLRQNDFFVQNANAVILRSTFGSAIRSRNNTYGGTGGLINASLGTILFELDTNDCEAANVVSGGQVSFKSGFASYEVYRGMRIGDAFAAVAADTPAPAAGSRYVIHVHPGTYAQNLTPGVSHTTLVGIGDPANVIVSMASGALITLDGRTNLVFRNLTLQGTAMAAADSLFNLTTGANTGIRIEDCIFDMTGAAAGNALYAVNSASAFAHTVTLERCVGTVGGTGASAFIRETTGTLAATLRDCHLAMNSANGFIIAGAATVLTMDSFGGTYVGTGAVATTGAAAHRITFNGGELDLDAASVHGAGARTVWKTARQTYRVVAGLLVQHAIDAAAADAPVPAATARYSVLVHPGLYVEALTMSQFVDVRGVGAREDVIIRQADGTVVTLATAVLENVTLDLNAPSVARSVVVDAAGITAALRRVAVTITTPGAFAHNAFLLSAGATNLTLEECQASFAAGAALAAILNASVASAPVTVRRCDFGFTVDTNGVVVRQLIAGSVVSLFNCRLFGGTNHLLSSAGTIRIRNSQYRNIARSATGVIVDETLPPPLHPYHSLRRTHPTLAIANENIATRVAIGGAVLPGGAGQVRLRINDNAADAAGTEQNADAAGSLASTWTPANCPRYVMQFSVNAFRATTSMFFGLRGALGAAVPGAAEHHAGFIWTGAAFNASSSNGGGVGATTALTTPSTGAQHTLEVIVVGGLQVEFYIDGILVATHAAAAGVPTAALSFQEYEISTGAGAATTSDITLRSGFTVECPA